MTTMMAIRWRRGWAATKIAKLSPDRRIKRRARMRRDIEAGLEGILPFPKHTKKVTVTLDVTTSPKQAVTNEDLFTITSMFLESLEGANALEGVVLKPVQRAKAHWRGTEQEYKAHQKKVRRIARRYQKRGMRKLADGLLASLDYFPAVEFELASGEPSIRDGLDTGEPSIFYECEASNAVRQTEPLRDGAWASAMMEGPSLNQALLTLRKTTNRLIHFKHLPGWHRFIELAVKLHNKDSYKLTLRDWG